MCVQALQWTIPLLRLLQCSEPHKELIDAETAPTRHSASVPYGNPAGLTDASTAFKLQGYCTHAAMQSPCCKPLVTVTNPSKLFR